MKLRGKDRGTAPVATPAPMSGVHTEPLRPTDASLVPGGRRLGELFVDANIVDRSVVVAALVDAQNGAPKRLGRRLIDQGVVTERDVAWAVAQQHGLEAVDLRTVTPEPVATRLLDEATARQVIAIPLALYQDQQQGEMVAVAVALPSDAVQALLRRSIGRPVRIMVAAESDIVRAIGNSYRALTGVSTQIRAFEAQHTSRRESARTESTATADEAPVVQVVQMMITQALRDRASDIHIEPQHERIRVRYRIDGALHDVLDLPASMGPVVASRIKILGGMNIVERRRAQDGQISMEIEGRPVDIRVSTTAVVEGEKVVLRLLDKSRELLSLEHLGMPHHMITTYRTLLRAPYGMVICAGPTGSGKTTTLYG